MTENRSKAGRWLPTVAALATALPATLPGGIAVVAEEPQDLATAAQNPIASMISLPFQNNTYFDIGPDDSTANAMLIQPVLPASLGEDWNVILRAIVPLIYVEGFDAANPYIPNATGGVDDTFGLGDVNLTAYFSPKALIDLGGGKFTWGVGPSLTFDTATDKLTGSEKWSAGPGAVGVFMKKPWVAGALVRQLWSYAGDSDRRDVNQLLVQPFVNFNLPDNWYLVSAPVITANWSNGSDGRWAVPVGGGFGKLFTVGAQPINANTQAFWYAEAPDAGPDWALRFQLTFLFPAD